MSTTITVVGVSHARTPAAVRERVHVAPERAAELARSLAAGTREVVVLATCNRTELYVTGTDTADARHRAILALTGLCAGDELPFNSVFAHTDEYAAAHLFRVAAGLDATVLGDTHVAAQVRRAHSEARALGATGPLLDRLFESSTAASKRIRTETAISSGPTSIPAAAIAAAARVAGPLSQRRLLVIGAGAIATSVVLNALSHGCRDIVVANRNVERARALARRVGGRGASLEVLDGEMAAADVVVSATAAPGFVIAPEQVKRCTRPLAIFDLGLPRDIDPAVCGTPLLQLLDLDDLAHLVAAAGATRRADRERAEAIAREEAARYEAWRRGRVAVPAIVALRGTGEHARQAVLARHAGALARLAPHERGLVETITSQLVARLVHEPTRELLRSIREEG
jgi:glutamyl-tRNA reductase